MPADRPPSLAYRTFTLTDQQAFAALSGDRNPMHLDAEAARRTQAGEPVVHGVHAVLWALDVLVQPDILARENLGISLRDVRTLRVQFQSFLFLNQPTHLTILRRDAAKAKIAVYAGERCCIVITLGFGLRQASRFSGPESEAALPPDFPDAPEFADLPDMTGTIGACGNAAMLASQLFPALCMSLLLNTVVSIALLSTIIGMRAPGLHSIFSALEIDLLDAPSAASGLMFEVVSADPRFRLVEVAARGHALSGKLTAFMRFAPVEPPLTAMVQQLVDANEFAGRHALVVGGSRGIGATVAQAICAGGGTALITYATGIEQARSVASDINTALARNVCSIRHLNVEEPTPWLEEPGHAFTHVYYCATNRIFGAASEAFDRNRLDRFLSIYVDGFHRIVEALLKGRQQNDGLSVLYPSSIAVTERPKGMTEYAMAKAAGEILCADLARNNTNLTITCPRLPRILTDQTATVPPVESENALSVVLPLLRTEGPTARSVERY